MWVFIDNRPIEHLGKERSPALRKKHRPTLKAPFVSFLPLFQLLVIFLSEKGLSWTGRGVGVVVVFFVGFFY